MNKFIPREKMSKRHRKTIDAKKRILWSVNPVTRAVENRKKYNRKKQPRNFDSYFDSGTVFISFS